PSPNLPIDIQYVVGDVCSPHVACDDSFLRSPSATLFSFLICATTQPRQPFKRLGVCTDALEYAHFKRFATETSLARRRRRRSRTTSAMLSSWSFLLRAKLSSSLRSRLSIVLMATVPPPSLSAIP